MNLNYTYFIGIIFLNYILITNFYCYYTSSTIIDQVQLFEDSRCDLPSGGYGICKRTDNCTYIINGIIKYGENFYKRIKELHCTWSDNIEIICCPDVQIDSGDSGHSHSTVRTPPSRSTSTTIQSPVTQSRLNARKSEIACNEYMNRFNGPPLITHIIGGTPTELGEFPHMVALGYQSEKYGITYDFNCGGTVINTRYILTAAHCIKGRLKPIIARMGKIYLDSNQDDVEPVDRNITKIISHPLYRSTRKYHDIALLLVDRSIEFNEYVRPACLRSNLSDTDENVELIVTGWGTISVEKDLKSNVMLKANVTSMPLERCNASILEYNDKDYSLPKGIIQGQLCAYDPTARHDTCEGDSGGPIQLLNRNRLTTVIGVTSFGISCATKLPSIYTRVAFYLDWIESIAWTD